MSEHSKGPWRSCHDGKCKCGQIWSIAEDHPVAKVERGEWGDTFPSIRFVDGKRPGSINPQVEAYTEMMSYGSVHEDVAEANAKLIAASPDLLEACKGAKKYLQEDLVEPGRTVFWKLVSAINKAEKGKYHPHWNKGENK